MTGWLKYPLRVTLRLCWVAGELLLAAIAYLACRAFQPGENALLARGFWLRQSSRRLLRIFGCATEVNGTIPSRGMLICNHLSYVDILVLGSLTPAVFVAKSEVKHWPVFGWFARLAGTVFVHRERRTQTRAATNEIQAVLDGGVLVILFPEGTSSSGETVLPFKSALLEPATRQTDSLSVGVIRYQLDDGDPAEEVCYWKDMTLVPHLVNLFSKRRLRAFVRFAPVLAASGDRKELAKQLHAEVTRLLVAGTVAN